MWQRLNILSAALANIYRILFMKNILLLASASIFIFTACQPVQSTQKSSSVAAEKVAPVASAVQAMPDVKKSDAEKLAVPAAHRGRLADRAAFIDEYAADAKQSISKAEFDSARAARLLGMDANKNGAVDAQEYADEYATRLEKKISAERKAQVAQTVIRFGAVDKNRDKKITLEEFQASASGLFNFLDKQKTGVISTETPEPEANGGSRSVLAMPDTHSVKGFLEIYDVNSDGKVTRADFDQQRKEKFNATDINHDGAVNSEEYMAEFENRLDRQIKQVRDSQVKQTYVRFKSLDADKNSSLTLQEFNTSGERIFNGWDVNRDGIVDVNDPLPEPKPLATKPLDIKSEAQGDKKPVEKSTSSKAY
jgi:Ca2+-binding EF-hand superfamily protein